MRNFSKALLAISVSGLIAAPAFAGHNNNNSPASHPACANADITLAVLGTHATNCKGFDDGNLLNDKAVNVTKTKSELGALGFTWDGSYTNLIKLDNLNGSQTLDFGKTLYGTTYIGVHFGNGQGGPGESTAFYVLDAAAGVNQIHLAYNASSNAVLFLTGLPPVTPGVPEPATWATMIGGLGVVGAEMRRRRRKQVVAA